MKNSVKTAVQFAKDQRTVELIDIACVAYVNKKSGDLAVAAETPQALKVLLDRTRTPDTVVVNDSMPKGNIWTFDNAQGHAAELVTRMLERLGVGDKKIQEVTSLLGVSDEDPLVVQSAKPVPPEDWSPPSTPGKAALYKTAAFTQEALNAFPLTRKPVRVVYWKHEKNVLFGSTEPLYFVYATMSDESLIGTYFERALKDFCL